jgi:hypothetical protein
MKSIKNYRLNFLAARQGLATLARVVGSFVAGLYRARRSVAQPFNRVPFKG